MSGRLLIILVFGFLAYLLLKAVIGFIYLSKQQKRRKEQSGGEMVQDPVCDTYLPRSRAVEKNVDGRTVYFCSRECAERYAEKKAEG